MTPGQKPHEFRYRKTVPVIDTNKLGGSLIKPGNRSRFEGCVFIRHSQDFQKKPSLPMRPQLEPGNRSGYEGRVHTCHSQDLQRKPSLSMRPSQAKPPDKAIASGGGHAACPPHLTPKFDRNTQQRLTRGHHDTAPQPTPLHLTKACPQHNATQRKSPSWICIPTEYQHWPAQRHGHPALHRTPTQESHHSLLQQMQMQWKMSSTLKSMPNVYKPTSHP